MKITFIRNLNPFFESTAPANRYEGLLSALIELGVDITIIVTDGFTSRSEYEEYKNNKQFKLYKVYYLYKGFYHNIWSRRLNLYLLSIPKKILVNFRIRKLMSKETDYVWLSYQNDVLEYFLKNRKRINGHTLIELNEYNDLYDGHIKFNNKFHKLLAIREDKVFRLALTKIDTIAVMTQALMKHYRKMTNAEAKFIHLPMTVDIERFRPTPASDRYKQPYIAYIGTFDNQKDGVEILIRAFIMIADKYPDINLYMAGFYHPDLINQKQLVANHNLMHRVIFMDVINKSEIPAFIQNADLLTLARPDSRQAQGGFPTKLGEYLATGNPVCVTKVGEIPNYLVDNESAFLAEPGSSESFADAMQRALSNKTLMNEVGENGRRVALTNFSTKVQAFRLNNFLIDCQNTN